MRRGRDADYKERRSRSPREESPDTKRMSASPPSKSRKLSPSPDRDASRERSASPPARVTAEDGYNSESPKETSRSPVASPAAARRYDASPYDANGRNRSPSPREDRSPVEDDEAVRSPRGSESP